jgi:hypothetical protein
MAGCAWRCRNRRTENPVSRMSLGIGRLDSLPLKGGGSESLALSDFANPDSEAVTDWLTFTQNEIDNGGTSWLR